MVGFKNLATTDPRSDVYINPDVYYGGYSRVLRFAVAAGIYLLLSLLQVVIDFVIFFDSPKRKTTAQYIWPHNKNLIVLFFADGGGRDLFFYSFVDMPNMKSKIK